LAGRRREMSQKNCNRVPKRQWAKWSEESRAAFNEVYGFMTVNPRLMSHPQMAPMDVEHWSTICWNAAWLAADAAAGLSLQDLVIVDLEEEMEPGCR
jgi:hypothetical protein